MGVVPPEVPGYNSIPSGLPNRGGGVGRVPGGGTAPAGGASGADSGGGALGKLAEKFPRFFGNHTDQSLLSRLNGSGIAPNGLNLAIAKQLLRYGRALDAAEVARIAQLWGQYGPGDPVALEAIVLLATQSLPFNGGTLQAMAQLLAGGPLSHLLARLTMAMQAEPDPKLAGLANRLTRLWQLGHLEQDLTGQFGQFQQLLAGLEADLRNLDWSRLGAQTRAELAHLRDLLDAQKLLAGAAKGGQFLPFFVWRDQQALPAELFVEADGGGHEGTLDAAGFTRITVAVETRRLGRVTAEITVVRDTLNIRFEVADEKIKKRVDGKLVLLRQRLGPGPYRVDLLSVHPTGGSRAVSALLPKRRDLRKLGRVHGMM